VNILFDQMIKRGFMPLNDAAGQNRAGIGAAACAEGERQRDRERKAVFEEQKKPGGFPVWYEPLTAYRIPKVFNLRMDSFERADDVSYQYDDWRFKNAYLMGWLNLKAAAFLQTFRDYPPSQAPASFTIDQVQ
jgi:hypothetical protein